MYKELSNEQLKMWLTPTLSSRFRALAQTLGLSHPQTLEYLLNQVPDKGVPAHGPSDPRT